MAGAAAWWRASMASSRSRCSAPSASEPRRRQNGADRGGQAQPVFQVAAACLGPGPDPVQGGADVREIGFQPVEPVVLLRPVQAGPGLGRQREVVAQVPFVHRVGLAGLGQPGQRVLADGGQQAEPRGQARRHLDQAVLGQSASRSVIASGSAARRPPPRRRRRTGRRTRPDGRTASRAAADSSASLQSRVARSVCWRCGRFRGPPVSSGSRACSWGSSACGGYSRTRAAASSIASGSPSRAEQIAAVAASASPAGRNPGRRPGRAARTAAPPRSPRPGRRARAGAAAAPASGAPRTGPARRGW